VIRLLIATPSPVVRGGLESPAASVPGMEVIGSFPDLSTVEDLRLNMVLAAVSLDTSRLPAGLDA
jgi:hypothetical protein